MKIGILTYHDGVNFGGYLQAFALQNTLNELGYENVLINYKNRTHWWTELKSLFFTKRPTYLLNNLKKYLKFKKEQKRFVQTAFSFDIEKIYQENFDLVIVGSDEIWNIDNDLFTFDGAYFGQGVGKNTKLISYAASFGKVTLAYTFNEEVIEGLKRFDHISVRDYNSQEIISHFLGQQPPLVLDPTFLYDFSKLVEEPECQNYILFYGIHISDEYIRQLKDYAKANNKKIISVGFFHRWADENRVALSPFEWQGYIKKADAVVTNMFHGTVFSIIFNKQFVSFGSEIRTNKLHALGKMFKIEDRIVLDQKADLASLLGKKIFYDEVNLTIKVFRESSIGYLKKCISEARS